MASRDLSGRWRLLHGAGAPEGIPDRIPARVPGGVHLDLLREGLIAPPHEGLNALRCAWVDDVEWTLERTFPASDEERRSRRIDLVFEGADTVAEVELNGEPAGRVANMFHPHRLDVTGRIRSRNTLRVRFTPASRYTAERAARLGELRACFDNQRGHVRKAAYMFGWDWGPRLVTAGLFRPVRLETFDAGRIADAWVRGRRIGSSRPEIAATIEIEALRAGTASIRVSVAEAGGEAVYSARKRIRVAPGTDAVAIKLPAHGLRLWEPVGTGVPALYDVLVEVAIGTRRLEPRCVRTGFRTVTLDRRKGGFRFVVNGKPVPAYGANWIPCDSFPGRVRESDEVRLVTDARLLDMNMLRVWGGGLYGSEAFYDACDREGILVWQDFMFACGLYPEDPEFKADVAAEAREVLRRIRNHPSLAFLAGGNENHQGFEDGWFKDLPGPFRGRSLYHSVLPRAAKALAPDVPYAQDSPYGGKGVNSLDRGDHHEWSVWSGDQPIENYRERTGRFLSEFGFQGMPGSAVLQRFGISGEPDLASEEIVFHNRQEKGGERLARYLAARQKPPRDFEELCFLTQANQADAIRCAFEACRIRLDACGGALVWQLQDCWPVTSWSLIDHGGWWKPAAYAARRALRSRLVAFEEEGGAVGLHVVNGGAAIPGAEIRGRIFDRDGVVLVDRTVTADLPAGKALLLMRLAPEGFGAPPGAPSIAAGEVTAGGRPVTRAVRFLRAPKDDPERESGVAIRPAIVGGRPGVRVEARGPARGVWLDAPGFPGRFEDNFLDFAGPGAVDVAWVGPRMTSGDVLQRALQWRSVR